MEVRNKQHNLGFGAIPVYHECKHGLSIADDPVFNIIKTAVEKDGFRQSELMGNGRIETMRLDGPNDEAEKKLTKTLLGNGVTEAIRIPSNNATDEISIKTVMAQFVSRLIENY